MNNTQVAVITGAGSGVGQATAIKLGAAGWSVALVGRREEALHETAKLMGEAGSMAFVFACDISDASTIDILGNAVINKFGHVDALINAAGNNAPQRSLEVLSLKDYKMMIDTNMNGAYYCVQAFLPHMRKRKTGTIVNIVSDAAKQASAKAGPAYVMSKCGMSGLTQAINAEERIHGIRASAIFPGDIDTPLLDKRPSPPPAEARQKMMKSEDIAECVALVVTLPMRAVIEEILVRPR
jgi:NADP-dependent 3-hydroxy acid dehydrogenase YdfG